MPQPTMLTDWYCIMQSGKTIDGRNIDPQWITDMAETYSRDLYTASINYEHLTFGTYGLVHEVEARTLGADLKLFARLEPNENTIALNKANRGKFFSAEVLPNFRGTGKAYLKAVALTDDPASVGTSQLKFNCELHGSLIASPIAIPAQFTTDIQNPVSTAASEEDAAKTIFSRFLSMFGAAAITPNKQDEDAMNLEQFGELKTLLTSLSDRIGALEKAKPAEPEPKTDNEKPSDFAALSGVIDELVASQKALTEEFAALKKEVPGTVVPPTTGDGEQLKPLY